MILMQRLVTSSTRAIRTALERRLEVLELPAEHLSLFPEDIGSEWAELDSQDQMEEVLTARLKASGKFDSNARVNSYEIFGSWRDDWAGRGGAVQITFQRIKAVMGQDL